MPSSSIWSIWPRKSHCKIWSYWIIHVFHQAWFLLFSYFFERISFCRARYWSIFENHKSFGKVGITKDPRGDGVFTQAEPILIERGGCFGEVALANKCTRTATVVCMEYTELLVIDKEDFDNLKLDRLVNYWILVPNPYPIFRFIHLEQDARRQCFQSITPISNFPYADHLMLAQTTRTAFYPINTVIKKSDTLSDYTYFVVRGIIEIFRVIELNECEEYHRAGFTDDSNHMGRL